MLIIFLTVENNVCLLSPLLLQSDSLICWCRLGAGRLGGGFESVGRLSLWQACCKGSALRHPSGLGTARAASHFLLMTSYVAGIVQKSLLEMEKHRNDISRVVFYILLLRLVLVTRWKRAGPAEARIAIEPGEDNFGLPCSLLVSWEDQGIRLTSCFLNAVA